MRSYYDEMIGRLTNAQDGVEDKYRSTHTESERDNMLYGLEMRWFDWWDRVGYYRQSQWVKVEAGEG